MCAIQCTCSCSATVWLLQMIAIVPRGVLTDYFWKLVCEGVRKCPSLSQLYRCHKKPDTTRCMAEPYCFCIASCWSLLTVHSRNETATLTAIAESCNATACDIDQLNGFPRRYKNSTRHKHPAQQDLWLGELSLRGR